jgi:hypothetical protein
MFHQLMDKAAFKEPVSAGYAVLGTANYLVRFPGAFQIKRFLSTQAEIVANYCSELGWIDRWQHADWPLAIQAIAVAARHLQQDNLKAMERQLVAAALERTQEGTVFLKPGDDSAPEESPVTAGIFIEALGAAYYESSDNKLINPIRAAADWFLGANRPGLTLYDFTSGGCHDALTPSGLNSNQGTEATIYCMLAFLTLQRLAALGLEGEAKKPNPVEEGKQTGSTD